LKKIAVILVFCFYLVSLFQVSVSFHYCGKRLQSIVLRDFHKDKSCCGKGSSCSKHNGPNKGCCKDVVAKSTVSNDQHVTKHFVLSSFSCDALPVLYSIPAVTRIVFPIFETFYVSHSPPLVSRVRLHILNCVFLI
jgi:hypothetical protein